MLVHLVQASRRPARSWLALAPQRCYATPSEAPPEDSDESGGGRRRGQSEGGPEDPFKAGPTYAQWLSKEGIKYKDPHRPNNWLGGKPFPLNPSFKPPPPVSDQLRTMIWQEYMVNPNESRVRVLAQRHGLSIARVDAILRLKGLEEHWIKKKPLQTGFLRNMEHILDVPEAPRPSKELSSDAIDADQLSEETKDIARNRYQRLFWEPVVEGKDGIMSASLARATTDGVESTKLKDISALKKLRSIKPETHPEVVLERPGRATIRFVDAGTQFVDIKDQLKRVEAAKHRGRFKRKRNALREAAFQRWLQHQAAQLASKQTSPGSVPEQSSP